MMWLFPKPDYVALLGVEVQGVSGKPDVGILTDRQCKAIALRTLL